MAAKGGSTQRSFGRSGISQVVRGHVQVAVQQRGPVRSSPRPLKHI